MNSGSFEQTTGSASGTSFAKMLGPRLPSSAIRRRREKISLDPFPSIPPSYMQRQFDQEFMIDDPDTDSRPSFDVFF